MLVFLMFLIYFWDFQWWKYLGLAAYDSWDPGGSFCLATGWENPSKHLVFGEKPLEDDWSEETNPDNRTSKHLQEKKAKNKKQKHTPSSISLCILLPWCLAKLLFLKNHLFTKYLGTERPCTIEPEIHWGQVVEAVVPWCIARALL